MQMLNILKENTTVCIRVKKFLQCDTNEILVKSGTLEDIVKWCIIHCATPSK